MSRRKMSVAPDLVPCPECHFLLEKGKGPGGVAWHGCGMWPPRARADLELDAGAPTPIRLALEAAGAPDLTPEAVAIAYSRLLLFNMASSGDIVGNPGDVFAGIGKFAETATGDEGGLAGLMRLLQGDGDAE